MMYLISHVGNDYEIDEVITFSKIPNIDVVILNGIVIPMPKYGFNCGT